jgi:hypothetical protein
MNRKIVVMGLACLSAVAVAQSNGDQGSEKKKSNDAATHQVQAPRDQATGMASGKREAAQPAKTDAKTSAVDDWDLAKGKGAKTSAASWDLAKGKGARTAAPQASDSNSVHVAAGDVNGDGKADVSTPNNSGPSKGQNPPADKAKVQSPRDVATGQASGKRQHEPK